MLGRTPEQIVGIRVDQLADPALFYDRMIQAMARPLDAPGEPLEMPFRLPDGTEITLELVATKTLDEHQAPVLVVNVRDVTERHAVMEAVRKSEALNRAILDAIATHIGQQFIDQAIETGRQRGLLTEDDLRRIEIAQLRQRLQVLDHLDQGA